MQRAQKDSAKNIFVDPYILGINIKYIPNLTFGFFLTFYDLMHDIPNKFLGFLKIGNFLQHFIFSLFELNCLIKKIPNYQTIKKFFRDMLKYIKSI